MSRIFDALEICLQEIENGADVESVLSRFPDLAAKLRPILKTAIAAKELAPSELPPNTIRRARARVMQRSAEIREAKVTRGATSGRPRISFFLRLAVAFSIVACLLLASGVSGIGLVTASADALPGERLYSVKRGWENIRLILAIDPNTRTALETQFYYERLSEVTALLAEGRVAPVEFAGFYLQADGQVAVSGIQIIINDLTALPPEGIQNGDAALVFGTTTPNGTVQANAIHLLPNPSVVPPGDPTPTAQVKPSVTPSPAFTSTSTPTPTPTVQPTISILPPTSAKPSSNDNNNDDNNNDDDN